MPPKKTDGAAAAAPKTKSAPAHASYQVRRLFIHQSMKSVLGIKKCILTRLIGYDH